MILAFTQIGTPVRTMFCLFIISVFPISFAQSADNTESNIRHHGFSLRPVLKDFPLSWAIAVAPDDTLFITHRSGNISRVVPVQNAHGHTEYQTSSLEFAPEDILLGGQGGLLDLIFHPHFTKNAWAYASYSAKKEDGNIVKIVRFKLEDNTISEIETIFELATVKSTPVHYGGRLAFSADNALLLSSGDGFDYREKAQVKDNHLGKILRMTDEGEAHPDNPFYGQGGNAAYVLSLGHRNPQGLLVTKDQTVIAHEHGPAGGDEINIIKPGLNYGWPVITNGKDYSGASISPFIEYPGMQQPNIDWTPSIAPSGMSHYYFETIPALKDTLLVTSLKFQQIYAIDFARGMFGKESALLSQSVNRLRDIEVDNSGVVWVLSDGEPAVLYQLKTD